MSITLSAAPIQGAQSTPIIRLERKGSKKSKPYVVYVNDQRESKYPVHTIEHLDYPEGFVAYPLPRLNTRDVLYIFGASGVGKSTYIAKYIDSFVKLSADPKVFVFSRLGDDPAFYDYDDYVQYVPITEDYEGIQIDDIPEYSLCIFDDIDTIPDKKLRDEVLKTRQDVLEVGRHRKIYCCVTSHLATDYARTRSIINEANQITFFPSSNKANIKNFLKVKIGLPNQQIEKVLNTRSRWVTINTTYPQFFFNETSVELL